MSSCQSSTPRSRTRSDQNVPSTSDFGVAVSSPLLRTFLLDLVETFSDLLLVLLGELLLLSEFAARLLQTLLGHLIAGLSVRAARTVFFEFFLSPPSSLFLSFSSVSMFRTEKPQSSKPLGLDLKFVHLVIVSVAWLLDTAINFGFGLTSVLARHGVTVPDRDGALRLRGDGRSIVDPW